MGYGLWTGDDFLSYGVAGLMERVFPPKTADAEFDRESRALLVLHMECAKIGQETPLVHPGHVEPDSAFLLALTAADGLASRVGTLFADVAHSCHRPETVA